MDLKNISDKLNEGIVRSIGLQILNGVRALHQLKIIHRDIKAENILLHFPDLSDDLLLNVNMKKE